MKYMSKNKRIDIRRNFEIDLAIENYQSDQRKHIFELLDEIVAYPAGLQKTIFNYKKNYDDEQEMFSREIIHMYKTGETDPLNLLARLMQKAYNEPDSGSEEEDEYSKAQRPRLPNLSCFRKKDDDAAN